MWAIGNSPPHCRGQAKGNTRNYRRKETVWAARLIYVKRVFPGYLQPGLGARLVIMVRVCKHQHVKNTSSQSACFLVVITRRVRVDIVWKSWISTLPPLPRHTVCLN
jgi:hypothetical protein